MNALMKLKAKKMKIKIRIIERPWSTVWGWSW
jgi:hypothetical protein